MPAPCRGPCVSNGWGHVSQINNLRMEFGGSVIGVGFEDQQDRLKSAGLCTCSGEGARVNITVFV
jgi:hypothetical protein